MLFCAGCGTELNLPNETQTESLPKSMLKNRATGLNAGSATIILLAYMSTQIFCGYSMEVVASRIAAAQGIHNLQQVNSISDMLVPTAIVLSFVLGGIVIVLMSFALITKHLKDTSPIGAAWVTGRWEFVVKGLIIGLIIGACDQTFILIARHYVTYKDLDPLHRMAFTPGLPQIIWVVVAVLLAPPVEEMLFRGVLYGGYRKSFGPFWAAVSTTLLFVALHIPYYTHFLSNVIGIIGATLAALWCRLRWKAIGPAIGVHIGYNSMAALIIVCKTWH